MLPAAAGIAACAGAGGCHRGRWGAPRAGAPAPEVTLAAVGDILLARGVGREIEQRGVDYPLSGASSVLKGADLAFGNLECALSRRGTHIPKLFSFKAPPERVACLQSGGLGMLSLANNHSFDCGRTGLTETMETLRAAGIRWCGAGTSLAEAEQPAMVDVRGVRIAFVGFSQFIPEGLFLREDRPTIALAEAARVERAVRAARARADVVVASFHWGVEFRSRPTPLQSSLARRAVDAGADLVLGHHPHVLQGFEVVRAGGRRKRPALIAYSLGNFVFDQREHLRAETLVLRCRVNRDGVQAAEILPMQIRSGRPEPPAPGLARQILARLTLLTAERGSRLSEGRLILPLTRTTL